MLKNWKTSLWGVIGGAILIGQAILAAHAAGQPITKASIGQIVLGIVLGGLGISAKDRNVTGGTVRQ